LGHPAHFGGIERTVQTGVPSEHRSPPIQAAERDLPTAAGHIHLVQIPNGENGEPVSLMRRRNMAVLARHPDWPKPEGFTQPQRAWLADISLTFHGAKTSSVDDRPTRFR